MRIFIVLVLLLAPVFGQTATLRGVVTDDSGALVPGAAVRLIASSKQEQTAITNAEGAYTFANLTAGDYTLQASATGLAMPRALLVVAASNCKSRATPAAAPSTP